MNDGSPTHDDLTVHVDTDRVAGVDWRAWVAHDLLWAWIDGVVALRAPESPGTGDGENGLRGIATQSGWLGDEETGRIAPAETFPGGASRASWLPDRTTLEEWKKCLQ